METTAAAPMSWDALDRTMRSLLHARRIAIVGASPKQGFANNIQKLMVAAGYEGEILPVNPNYTEVLGCPAYPTVDAIPGHVDLVYAVVPFRYTLDVLAQCERAQVGAINIITSGFGEKPNDAEGAARQQALRDFARRTGIRLVGPNCLGIISVPNKMNAMSSPFNFPLHRGPIAGVFQSGLLSYSLIQPCHDRYMGFTYVITTGNEADLETSDFIRWLVEDDETRVIAGFIEQFRDPDKLLEVAELAAERGKPLVMLKIGRSEKGRQAALAHTGSLVGSDAIADAVMRQHGITRVYSMDEMIETLAIFHTRKLPSRPGVVTMFMSGGAAGLVSDIGSDLGLPFPEFAPETTATLEELIPVFGTVGNPLDVTGQIWETPDKLHAAIAALAEDPNIGIVVYGRAYPGRMDMNPDWAEFPPDLIDRYPDTLFLIMSLVAGYHRTESNFYEQPMQDPADALGDVPFLQGTENSLKAIRALLRYTEFQRARREGRAAAGDSVVAEQARAIVRAAGGHPLVEREAKRVLALYGLPVTREALAATADEAVAAARAIGYPVVLKVESPDIVHKTEAGGVLLEIDSDEGVREGFERIIERARRYNSDAHIDGVLVQEMAPRGRELIVGMSQDASFGPAVAVGLGGVFVETLRDVALGVPPLSAHDAQGMLTRLRGYAVLEGSGARGAGPADVGAVVDILVRFSRLCRDLRDDVAEIDINPLLVFERGQGAKVVDCLIVPTPPAPASS